MPGACASRALAAAGLLLCLPALGAEPIDFKIVARPAHWGGLELPGKPSSHTQRRLHGAVIPHIQRLKESVKGHESYRIYFIKNGRQAQNVYAREKPELPASRCSALLPPPAGARRPRAWGERGLTAPLPRAVFGDDYSTMSLSADDKTPLFQVPHPFGNDFGGVNRELIEVKPASEFDTWLTVGEDNGNSKSDIRCTALPPLLSSARLFGPPGLCLMRKCSAGTAARLGWAPSTRSCWCPTALSSR